MDQEKRYLKSLNWDNRLKKLSSRSKNPMTAKDFCAKYNFHESHLCRVRKGKFVPQDAFFKAVEDALKKEKV